MDLTQATIVGLIVLGVLAFIAWPMLSRRRTHAAGALAFDDERIEARIGQYRAALRGDTICQDCLFANVEGARFCAECGSRLPAARASA